MVHVRNLTLVAILGLLHWLFGNLYEAVVFSPNWIDDSPAQLARMHGLFVHTSPTLYFVPVTQLATLLAFAAHALNRSPLVTRDFRRATVFALLATALNALIVSTIVLRIFSPDYAALGDELHALCWRWNVLNVGRMALVATTVFFLFAAFRKLDREAVTPA